MKPFPSIAQLTSGDTSQLPKHEDIRGWNSDDPIFDEIVEVLAPKTIIEVGSWKGRSAMHFAKASARFLTDIICVDTWLGGVDHVLASGSENDRLLDSVGCPRLYHQFIRNFKDSPHAQRIYPIQNTSINGARILSHSKISAEIIYIDGSHEYSDVYDDMVAFWSLVSPGGIMFGDDFGFPGVGPAVTRFTIEQNLKFGVVRDNFWVITKPLT
jgi:predicted O-methyltransferase YrrM